MNDDQSRMGSAEGEARYAGTESKLAAAPRIAVPAIIMEGEVNGAPQPPAKSRAKFVGKYELV